jgi:hypothetical protein
MFTTLFPGNKLLGYFQLSLTGQKEPVTFKQLLNSHALRLMRLAMMAINSANSTGFGTCI